jgi:hypothetical protein
VTPPPYAFASSPVLWHDLVIITYDVMATSCTFALDKLTGQVRWQADRTPLINVAEGNYLYGYSTPVLLEQAGQTQLIHHTGCYLFGYDVATGEELWRFQSPGYAVVVSPVLANHVVFLGGASTLGRSRCLSAVEVKQEDGCPRASALWRARRIYADVPSPVVYGGYVYTITHDGLASCLEASSGKVCWTQRLSGSYEASVVAADGKLFFCNTAGVTTVVLAAPEFNVLGRNDLDESMRASPAIAGGKIFIRGEHQLFCVGGSP